MSSMIAEKKDFEKKRMLLFLLFVLLLFVALALFFRISMMASNIDHINSFIGQAVTFDEMEKYVKRVVSPA